MNRRLKNIMTGFIIACTAAIVMPFHMLVAYAGDAKIAFSDPSATVGQEFNVSVKITATEGTLGAADVMLSYDPAYIEFVSGSNANGGAGSVRLIGTMDSDNTTAFNYSLKFKAVQAGNSSISVASYEVYDKDTQAVNVTKVGSSSVKVAAPATYSKEAGLSSLKVSPGTLNPAFSPDVTSYTVNVGGDVNKLAVSAAAKDSKAKVLVNGDSNLKTGENTVVCKVTAEDGQTTRSYKITVNKSASAETDAVNTNAPAVTQGVVLGELTVEIDGTQYHIASSFDPAGLPQGYTQSTAAYGGTEVMSGTGNDLTLLYLQDAAGNGGFFIYDETSAALSPYVTIDVTAKSIVVLPAGEEVESQLPEGFAQTMIQLNGNYKVKGWVWQSDAEQKYCVVYGMNENGEKGFYRYDIGEKTFQRYFEDPAVQSKYDDAEVEKFMESYNALQKDYDIRFFIMIGLIILCLILFFIIINLIIKRRDDDYPGSRGGRSKAPAPVKRRAPEQPSKEEPRVPYRERPVERKQSLDVYQTRSNSQVRGGAPANGSAQTRNTGYTIRHEDPRELPRQREADREERARLARERLERERREDERRKGMQSRPYREAERPRRREDDDFEFMDLD